MRIILLVGLALLLPTVLVPAQAGAATADAHVTTKGEEDDTFQGGPVTYTAAAGETNRLTMTQTKGGQTVFTDPGATVHATGQCKARGAHTAVCPGSEDFPVVHLGDRNDRLVVRKTYGETVSGGPGDDTLIGSRTGDTFKGNTGDDTLRGGKGEDELTGGGDRDTVLGGPGNDELYDGETDDEAAPDHFDGGPNESQANGSPGDTLDYGERTDDIQIDLAAGTTNLEDDFTGVESFNTGAGDDTVTGDDGDNWFEGGAGDDTLSGGAGDDIPQGGPGDDTVTGGEGDDVVWGDDGRDVLSGGAGEDYVISLDSDADTLSCGDAATDAIRADSGDTADVDCEGISTFGNGLQAPTLPVFAAGTATFAVECTDLECKGTLALRGPGGVAFGSQKFTVKGKKPVAVTLTPAAVTALQSGVAVTVDYVSADPDLAESGGYVMQMKS